MVSGEPLLDTFFDQLFTKSVRDLSVRHWTPAEIAIRAAKLLTEGRGAGAILDVGSGSGKFCVLGALTTEAHFTGIEIRPPLVEAARALAHDFDLESRIEFLATDALEVDWSAYHGFYLYNPFYEHVAESTRQDGTLDFGMHRLEHYVRGVQKKLNDLPSKTRVVVYHGFGGGMALGYKRLRRELAGSDVLELWEKS